MPKKKKKVSSAPKVTGTAAERLLKKTTGYAGKAARAIEKAKKAKQKEIDKIMKSL